MFDMHLIRKAIFTFGVVCLTVFYLVGASVPAPAQSCEEPVIYEPVDMVTLRQTKERGDYVPYADNKRLREYEKDRERYISLHESVNGCEDALPAGDDAASEMAALVAKWKWDDESQLAPDEIVVETPDDELEPEVVPVWEQADPLMQQHEEVDESEFFELDIEGGQTIIQE